MSSYFLDGPIVSSSQVVITSQINNVLYTLNSYPGVTGSTGPSTLLILDSNIDNTSSDSGTVPIFNVTGSGTQVNFNSVNLGGLGFNADNQALITVGSEPLSPINTTYAPWGSPNILLSGVQYQLQNVSGSSLIFNYGSISDGGTVSIVDTTTSVIILPVQWFFGCQNGNAGFENNDAGNSILSAYCALNSGASTCTQNQVQTQGWTTLGDCENGVTYQYCTVGNFCGQSCKGPCQSSFDDCDYVTTTGGFSCMFDSNNLFVGQWWTQKWFIITAIVLGVLLLLFLIIAYFSYIR